MSDTPPGYLLHDLVALEQACSRAAAEADGPEGITTSWDWNVLGEGRFGVMFGLLVHPTEEVRLRTKVIMLGVFSIIEPTEDGDPGPSFRDFCQFGAPAIVFPFLREAVTSMLARADPAHPLVIPPMNMMTVMADMDFDKGTGMTVIEDHPDISKWL